MLRFDAVVKFLLPFIFATAAFAQQGPADKPEESQNPTSQDDRRLYREQIPGQSAAELDMTRMRLNELGYFAINPPDVKIRPNVSCSVPLLRIDGDKNARIQRSTPQNVDPKIVIPPKQPTCPAQNLGSVEEKKVMFLPEKK